MCLNGMNQAMHIRIQKKTNHGKHSNEQGCSSRKQGKKLIAYPLHHSCHLPSIIAPPQVHVGKNRYQALFTTHTPHPHNPPLPSLSYHRQISQNTSRSSTSSPQTRGMSPSSATRNTGYMYLNCASPEWRLSAVSVCAGNRKETKIGSRKSKHGREPIDFGRSTNTCY